MTQFFYTTLQFDQHTDHLPFLILTIKVTYIKKKINHQRQLIEMTIFIGQMFFQVQVPLSAGIGEN